MCVCIRKISSHLGKALRKKEKIKYKEKYNLKAQLHTEKNDRTHLVRKIYQGRGPRE